MLKEGDNAPDFSLDGSDGSKHALKEFNGKYLVLYFYPKDNTPGCTIEANEFNKKLSEIRKLGAEVVGVSKDDLTSHDKFKKKYDLEFLLLSDPSSEMIKSYGAYGNRGIFGMGTLRNTYIIDRNGKIAKIYEKVSPKGHASEVIEFLKSAK
ncbi:peroxiredoxin [Candidatus Marsarchaeota archaeon]|jgi:peroxiredoxin Q/BCP|nr:peroxiredoxin [Candidatus Marsarchaeota archaeon]